MVNALTRSLTWQQVFGLRPMAVLRSLFAVSMLVGVTGCAGCATAEVGDGQTVGVPDSAEVDVTLLLIGDAGRATEDDGVLAELTRQAAAAPDRTMVVFLGDNIYPAGLPEVSHPGRATAEARLRANMGVSLRSGARSLFVPGNHDWGDASDGGWEQVKRQEEFVERHGEGLIEFLPDGGCPGPVGVDLGTTLRIVVFDTQWLLQMGPQSPCVFRNEVDVFSGIDSIVRTAGNRQVVLAAHHPLDTTGPHGGFFALRDHLFPLRRLVSWLWVPLPGLGSLYPLVRSLGVSSQDLGSDRYDSMRHSLDSVLARYAPLAYVAGHDHSLQVMRGSSTRFILVSGAGPSTGITAVGSTDRSLFARGRGGFMRLDGLRNGRVRLGVFTLQTPDSLSEEYSSWLTESP